MTYTAEQLRAQTATLAVASAGFASGAYVGAASMQHLAAMLEYAADVLEGRCAICRGCLDKARAPRPQGDGDPRPHGNDDEDDGA